MLCRSKTRRNCEETGVENLQRAKRAEPQCLYSNTFYFSAITYNFPALLFSFEKFKFHSIPWKNDLGVVRTTFCKMTCALASSKTCVASFCTSNFSRTFYFSAITYNFPALPFSFEKFKFHSIPWESDLGGVRTTFYKVTRALASSRTCIASFYTSSFWHYC